MSDDPNATNPERRAFLRSLAALAALGTAARAFGGLPDARARLPGVRGPGGASTALPFEMLVFGDSIMWGQGLREEQKFSTAIQEWLRTRMPGTMVNRHVYAHSGARILADAVEDARPATHGEVPNHFPSIAKQIDVASTGRSPLQTFDPADVGLVLIDGGINDLGTKRILNLDPTVGRAWIREHTRERCVRRMHAVLPRVLRAFPNSRVVVTNYFPIVSDASAMVYIWELLRVWGVVGDSVELSSTWVKAKLVDQSMAFHEEYTSGLRQVIASIAAPRQEPVAGTAAGRARGARGAMPAVGALRALPPRIAMADVGFGAGNSYGATDTYLFYLNEPDPAASVRKPACVEQTAPMSIEFPNCLLAAAGHPNVRGARQYASAIQQTLEAMAPEWRTPGTADASRRALPAPGW